jgi:hypothetical protein
MLEKAERDFHGEPWPEVARPRTGRVTETAPTGGQ